MLITKKFIDELSYEVLGSAIEVHRTLGPGLIESVYEKCMLHEMGLRGIGFSNQLNIPFMYKNVKIDTNLRCDVLVENTIVVELKAIEALLPVHEAITLTYMKMLCKPKGLLINFHCTNIFRHGQKSFVNEFFSQLPDA